MRTARPKIETGPPLFPCLQYRPFSVSTESSRPGAAPVIEAWTPMTMVAPAARDPAGVVPATLFEPGPFSDEGVAVGRPWAGEVVKPPDPSPEAPSRLGVLRGVWLTLGTGEGLGADPAGPGVGDRRASTTARW
jgi:hypothetical protein